MSRQSLIVVLGVVVLAGLWLWPMSALLGCPPATRDALLWIQRGAGPGWLSWALTERHFVGYRPLAALSFTANAALLGISAASFRAVDLGLFVLAGGLLAALARRWFGALPALVAAAVYFLHPAGEEIAVDVARRSYTLSAALLLAGLLVHERRVWLGAGLLGAAILCNEMAAVPALLAPALRRDRPWKEGWPALAVVAALALLRLAILRGGGGYGEANVILPWAEGGPLSSAPLPLQVIEAAGAGLYHTLLPVSGDGHRLPAPLLVLAAPLLAGLLRSGQLGRVLLAWYLGYTVLSAVTVTWFWRMAYPPLLPMGLAAALLVHRTPRLSGVLVALGLAAGVVQGPLVRGPRPLVADLQARARLIDALEETDGDRVLLALPYTRHWALSTTRWLAIRQPARTFSLIAHPQSPQDPVARAWERRPGTVKIHEDAVILAEGEGMIAGPRLVDAAALPEGAVLVWVEEDGSLGRLP